MGIKEDFNTAKRLAKSGEYEAAIAVLKKHKDNPKIAALIKQLQGRLKAEKPKRKRPVWQRVAIGIGMLSIVILFACGAMYIVTNWDYWHGGKERLEKQFSAISVCSYVEVYSDISSCDENKLLDIYGTAVDYCYQQYGEIPIGVKQATEQWIQCLLNEDVIFEILTKD